MFNRNEYVLRFSVHTTALESPSDKAKTILAHIRRSLSDIPFELTSLMQEVEFTQDTCALRDLTLEIAEDGTVIFRRHDPYLCALTTPAPHIAPEDVPDVDLPWVLGGVAHFNQCLALNNVVKPFREDVELGLHSLDEDDTTSTNNHEPFAIPLKNTTPFISNPRYKPTGNGYRVENIPEARIPNQSEGELYAFVLKNHSTTSLRPYMYYFDPATYAIEEWYIPFSDKPTLPSALLANYSSNPGILQLGGSEEVMHAFEFSVPEWMRRAAHSGGGVYKPVVDTSIIKFWLFKDSEEMSWVPQDGVLGYAHDTEHKCRANARRAGKGRRPHWVNSKCVIDNPEDAWDTIVRKITVYIK